MNRNIEIKARVENFDKLFNSVTELSDSECQILNQRDVFFNCPGGRLKLRIFEDKTGEMIFYNRENTESPTCSYYKIVPVENPTSINELFEMAYGIKGEVKKTRYLFFIGQTRIHLDKVENLGNFVELEVVLKENQSEIEGKSIADEIMKRLNINKTDLISNAYIDIVIRNQKSEISNQCSVLKKVDS